MSLQQSTSLIVNYQEQDNTLDIKDYHYTAEYIDNRPTQDVEKKYKDLFLQTSCNIFGSGALLNKDLNKNDQSIISVNYLLMSPYTTLDLKVIISRTPTLAKYYIKNIDYDCEGYSFLKESGIKVDKQGANSSVSIIIDKQGQKIARKKIDNKDKFLKELDFFFQYKGRYIVEINFYSKLEQQLFIECADYTLGSFYKNIKVANPFFDLLLSLVMFEGVNELHLSGIYHGDIKPYNVVLFTLPSFDPTLIQEPRDIPINIAQDFCAVDSFVQFQSSLSSKEMSQNINQSNQIETISQDQLMQFISKQLELKISSGKNYSDLLQKYFKIRLKFIDFYSSSPLTSSGPIVCYTNAFIEQSFLRKIKTNQVQICFQDKIFLDFYSTFRSLLLLATHMVPSKEFESFENFKCVEAIEDPLLKLILGEILQLFTSPQILNHRLPIFLP